MNSLGNKRVELFDMGAGVSDPTADDNVQMASGKFLSFCISVSLVWLCKDELSPTSVCFIILAVDYPMLVSLALLWSVQCKCESNFENIKLLGTLCLFCACFMPDLKIIHLSDLLFNLHVCLIAMSNQELINSGTKTMDETDQVIERSKKVNSYPK